jgi:hypothetical protein
MLRRHCNGRGRGCRRSGLWATAPRSSRKTAATNTRRRVLLFKLGKGARELVFDAKRRGLWVHCGRINSLKRYRAMEAIGVDSCDGTFLKFAPTKNLPRMQVWLNDLRDRPAMFKIGEL